MVYFSATVVEIIDSEKQVYKLCDRESNNYTLSEVESFSRIQVQTNDEHKSTRIDDDGDYDDDCDEDFNLKSDTYISEITSSDVEEGGGVVLEAPVGEERRNIGGEAIEIGEALDVNENVTSASKQQDKFFKKFIKLQAGQSLSNRIAEL